jgi:diaminopimelate epimerase
MSNYEFIFSKMHGLGNDYIVIDETKETIIPEAEKEEAVIKLCTKGFNIGADGVIFVTPSLDQDIRFRIFNADGSEAEMCGNGIRCFSKFVYDNGILRDTTFNVETLGGLKIVDLNVKDDKMESCKVNMGIATFQTKDIPMDAEVEEFIDMPLEVGDTTFNLTAISVGNPHAIIFTEDVSKIDLNKYGPLIENHEAFPERINVHFVEIKSKNEIEMITWERGAGPTYACGTGATSCVISGNKLGLLDNEVLVHLPGGDLNITVYEEDGQLGAFMEGVAVLSFDGVIDLEL